MLLQVLEQDTTENKTAPAVTPYIRRGKVIDEWIARVYNKSTCPVAPVKESVPTTNSFDKLQEVEDSPVEEEPVGQKKANRVEPEQSNVYNVVFKMPERVFSEEDTLQLAGFQVLPKDFEDDMGDFSKDFKVRSAPSSPKVSSNGMEDCIQ
ncbi:hypothetical protein LIER_12318 [Lithospermum erythrorhizon]|uniref:Uncharacterized protein n=1 Tax=Lithospermum erythrorhizon TaxID=34254 RepID=A0AAV3PT65_LITER